MGYTFVTQFAKATVQHLYVTMLRYSLKFILQH